jgi:hypothetical protein
MLCASCMQRQASRVACPARAYAATLHARRGDSGAKYAAERRILRVVGYYLYVSPSYGCVSNNAHIRSHTHITAYSLSFPYPYESVLVPTRGGRREKTRMVGNSMASVKKSSNPPSPATAASTALDAAASTMPVKKCFNLRQREIGVGVEVVLRRFHRCRH